jgi:hypothetical protein
VFPVEDGKIALNIPHTGRKSSGVFNGSENEGTIGHEFNIRIP